MNKSINKEIWTIDIYSNHGIFTFLFIYLFIIIIYVINNK